MAERNKDELIIPEGFFFEVYTPVTGRIKSPSLNKYLQYAKMCLSADADVTFVDSKGNLTTAFPLSKGPQPFLVREIRAVSTGVVAIIHDGVLSQSQTD